MRKFSPVVFLVFVVFMVSLGALLSLYAGDFTTVNNKGAEIGDKSGDVIGVNEQDSHPPSEGNPTQESDDGTIFSGYPETFIIPKGVCERNESVMEIKTRRQILKDAE